MAFCTNSSEIQYALNFHLHISVQHSLALLSQTQKVSGVIINGG